MRIRSVVASSSAVLGLALLLGAGPAAAIETLAFADFEPDVVGALARPGGPPTVVEEVWDESSGSQGFSEVVSWTGGKRYRISDAGVTGLLKGIRAPFSTGVSSGTLVVTAVLAAEQPGGGATCYVEGPEKQEWLGMIGFGSDGKWQVHGAGTSTPYAANHRYEAVITVHFGASPTTDYLVTDLEDQTTVIDSTGHSIGQGLVADRIVFQTGAAEEGAFTIDDILATR